MALFTITVNAVVNQPPNQIGNRNISLDYDELYTFTSADFTSSTSPIYQDPEGDIMESIKIITLPTIGLLTYNAIAVTALDEILKAGIDAGLLKYQADDTETTGYTDNDMTFDVSDVGSSTFSGLTPGIVTFIVDEVPNQAPTIGDNSLTTDYGVTIVFTTADFTTGTTPAYSDPEGDAAAQLKILTLPSSGLLKFNGINVTINQVINFIDITSGLLTYEPSLADTSGVSRNFTFSIADAGSLIFST